MRSSLLGTAILIAAGCRPHNDPVPIWGLDFVDVPQASTTAIPTLTVDDTGLLLAYVRDDAATQRFEVRRWHDGGWSPAHLIASGGDILVNWADVPAVNAADGDYIAHWLVEQPNADFAYDVMLGRSSGGLDGWRPLGRLHTDETASEHGFVSYLAERGGGATIVWLDGRHTVEDGGRMSLMARTLTADGELEPEQVLDPDVCTCCQTDAVSVGETALVVFRDRSVEDIRDIAVARRTEGQWESPRIVTEDGWQVAGCPVNGPAIAASGDDVVVVWFTGREPGGEIWHAWSRDGGDSFARSSRIDLGAPLGRVDAVLEKSGFGAVTWLEANPDDPTKARLLVRRLRPASLGRPRVLAEVDAGRDTGFPSIVSHEGELFVAWTTLDPEPGVRLARVSHRRI